MCEVSQIHSDLTEDVIELIRAIVNRDNFANFEIDASNATSKGDNYFGNVYRIKVSDKLQNKSKNLIVKKAPGINNLFPLRLVYSREISAYSKVLPTLYDIQVKYRLPISERFSYPKYYECIKEELKETIILEDLKDDGFIMHNRKKSLDGKHLELVIRALARFHATSFILKKVNDSLFQELSHTVSRKMEYGEYSNLMLRASYKKFLDVIENEESKNRLQNFLNDIIDKLKNYLTVENTEPYNVICHGDCWINNIMFKYVENQVIDVKFVDYQIIKYASPVTDISYAIFTSTDSNIRSQFYTRSLDLYYETLDTNLKLMGFDASECYPMEVYRDQIKSVMPFGIIIAVMLTEFTVCENDDAPEIDGSLQEFEDQHRSSSLFVDRVNGIVNDGVIYGFF